MRGGVDYVVVTKGLATIHLALAACSWRAQSARRLRRMAPPAVSGAGAPLTSATETGG
jgi:hypothetical protein